MTTAHVVLGSQDIAAAAGRRVRVMHVTENLGAGGLEQVVVTLCRTTDRSRFEPSVVCLRFSGALAAKLTSIGIPVFDLANAARTNYFAFRDVARIMRAQHIDVVHTHNTGALVDGGLGAIAAGVKTLIHTEHGRRFPDKLRYMLADHVLSHFAHRMVGVSAPTVRDMRRYERIAKRKLALIPNGVELDAYAQKIDQSQKRRELGLPAGAPIIGVTARLAEPKGIEYLLRALPALCSQFADLHLLIAGTGDLHATLTEEARQLGVADRVRFLGLRMDVPELLQVFDVYALPSVSEGMPMSLIEAMAAGCAIVATDVGGVSTMIKSEGSGLLVASKSPNALAAAISRLLTDRMLRERLGRNARDAAYAQFSARAMTRRYESFYLREDGDSVITGAMTTKGSPIRGA